ncbi:TMEM165/GDT1 family protein [Synechococcus sp. PCC 6312]|uniref:TMEM165/GDT1 family protein n=1 Tax=Synechococcus sp. (strain ATCC 27167 / PCC 6312) TaxID=195253 RepID=UPI00029EEE37|nr:TMEM165/GDT1 family protein [Synechococcus sp. PCC 6312]AFY61632.1 putative membrane protein [Synechococcus sp. PCC 6312]
MNWQLLGVSFVMVFLSELGDKSQLAAITLGGNARSARLAFLGVASGLVFTSFLGVLLGGQVSRIFPAPLLKSIAAIGFALLGLYLLWRPSPPLVIDLSSESEPSPDDLASSEISAL